jgi:hypothetical protein
MPQPWRPDAGPLANPAPDDFAPATTTMPVTRAALVLAVVLLLLVMGRSGAILDAAYGLPVVPGTETLIVLAEFWDGAMQALGVADAASWLRRVFAAGR